MAVYSTLPNIPGLPDLSHPELTRFSGEMTNPPAYIPGMYDTDKDGNTFAVEWDKYYGKDGPKKPDLQTPNLLNPNRPVGGIHEIGGGGGSSKFDKDAWQQQADRAKQPEGAQLLDPMATGLPSDYAPVSPSGPIANTTPDYSPGQYSDPLSQGLGGTQGFTAAMDAAGVGGGLNTLSSPADSPAASPSEPAAGGGGTGAADSGSDGGGKEDAGKEDQTGANDENDDESNEGPAEEEGGEDGGGDDDGGDD